MYNLIKSIIEKKFLAIYENLLVTKKNLIFCYNLIILTIQTKDISKIQNPLEKKYNVIVEDEYAEDYYLFFSTCCILSFTLFIILLFYRLALTYVRKNKRYWFGVLKLHVKYLKIIKFIYIVFLSVLLSSIIITRLKILLVYIIKYKQFAKILNTVKDEDEYLQIYLILLRYKILIFVEGFFYFFLYYIIFYYRYKFFTL